jgi:hypothetical protein
MRTTEPPLRHRRPVRESGSASAEAVLVLPALMVLFVVGLQFALYGLAEHAAALAVEEGAASVRALGGGPRTGRALALADVHSIAGAMLLHPRVAVVPGPDGTEEVRLIASVPALLPGLHLTVHAVSTGPAEEFRPG